ncbi:hypothetical protein ACOME3_005051 [Neoechinorhynchus agilis]
MSFENIGQLERIRSWSAESAKHISMIRIPTFSSLPYTIVQLSTWNSVLGPQTLCTWHQDHDDNSSMDFKNKLSVDQIHRLGVLLLNSELFSEHLKKSGESATRIFHKILFSKATSTISLFFKGPLLMTKSCLALTMSGDDRSKREEIIMNFEEPMVGHMVAIIKGILRIENKNDPKSGNISEECRCYCTDKIAELMRMCGHLLTRSIKTLSLAQKKELQIEELLSSYGQTFLKQVITAHLSTNCFSIITGKSLEQVNQVVRLLDSFMDEHCSGSCALAVFDSAKLYPCIRLQALVTANVGRSTVEGLIENRFCPEYTTIEVDWVHHRGYCLVDLHKKTVRVCKRWNQLSSTFQWRPVTKSAEIVNQLINQIKIMPSDRHYSHIRLFVKKIDMFADALVSSWHMISPKRSDQYSSSSIYKWTNLLAINDRRSASLIVPRAIERQGNNGSYISATSIITDQPASAFILVRNGALIALVFQTTSLVLLLRYSRTRSTPTLFINSSAIVMAELLKFVLSAVLVCITTNSNGGLKLFIKKEAERKWDFIKLAIPAFIYRVTYQFKILTTAMFSVLILHKKLSRQKWISLLILTIGVAFVQYPSDSAQKPPRQNSSRLLGLVAVTLACLSSGFAGVFFEKMMKMPGRSAWVQNLYLGR